MPITGRSSLVLVWENRISSSKWRQIQNHSNRSYLTSNRNSKNKFIKYQRNHRKIQSTIKNVNEFIVSSYWLVSRLRHQTGDARRKEITIIFFFCEFNAVRTCHLNTQFFTLSFETAWSTERQREIIKTYWRIDRTIESRHYFQRYNRKIRANAINQNHSIDVGKNQILSFIFVLLYQNF